MRALILGSDFVKLPNGDINPYSNVSPSNIFAWGNVGIGVPIPSVALSVKDNSSGKPTSIQIIKNDTTAINTISPKNRPSELSILTCLIIAFYV